MTSITPTLSPFLTNNFAPIKEEITADNLKVIGELPADLSGMFVRNGPNPQFSPIGQYHWFDGDGMLHGVRINNGKASYRNRYVRTHKFQVENQEGKAVWPGFLNPPQPDNPHGTDVNTANTALVYHAGHLFALWEGGVPYDTIIAQADATVFERDSLPVVNLQQLAFPTDKASVYTDVERIVAISDVHGQYELMRELLLVSGVIDDHDNWTLFSSFHPQTRLFYLHFLYHTRSLYYHLCPPVFLR